MADYISKYTGAQIDSAVASGSSTTGVINNFNTLSGSSTATISVGGGINTLSHITASGNISASGIIYASKFESAGESGETISFNDDLNITGNITASGDISASGLITAVGGISSSKGLASHDDITLYDKSAGGDILVKLHNQEGFATSDDGIIDVYQNNSVKARIHGNGTSYFNGGQVNFGSNISASGWISGSNIGASGTINGTLGTAAQTNITSVGTLTGLTTSGNVSASGDLYVGGNDIYDGNSGGTKRITLGAINKFEGDISSSGATIYAKNTIANDDATPSVANGTYFETGTNTDTITTFDGGSAGQIINVISKAAITYDVTSTTLKCGTTDLVTAAGDLTSWLFDGTNWTCLGFTDQSDDLS